MAELSAPIYAGIAPSAHEGDPSEDISLPARLVPAGVHALDVRGFGVPEGPELSDGWPWYVAVVLRFIDAPLVYGELDIDEALHEYMADAATRGGFVPLPEGFTASARCESAEMVLPITLTRMAVDWIIRHAAPPMDVSVWDKWNECFCGDGGRGVELRGELRARYNLDTVIGAMLRYALPEHVERLLDAFEEYFAGKDQYPRATAVFETLYLLVPSGLAEVPPRVAEVMESEEFRMAMRQRRMTDLVHWSLDCSVRLTCVDSGIPLRLQTEPSRRLVADIGALDGGLDLLSGYMTREKVNSTDVGIVVDAIRDICHARALEYMDQLCAVRPQVMATCRGQRSKQRTVEKLGLLRRCMRIAAIADKV